METFTVSILRPNEVTNGLLSWEEKDLIRKEEISVSRTG